MDEVLRVEELTKKFPGVLAVDRLTFGLARGELLAVLGENGAGKSTLTKMISGVILPDSGRIVLDGREFVSNTAHDSIKAGIAMVYQELSMVGSMSIAENIFANRQPINGIGLIQRGKLFRDTSDLMEKFNLRINPRTLVKHLSMGQQQLIEILKAISQNPKVLILDEPTSSLTETEVALLFGIIEKLKKEGLSFIYITHKLSEVFKLADRVLVMRDGKYIATKTPDEVTTMDLITLMVGREDRGPVFRRARQGKGRGDVFLREGPLVARRIPGTSASRSDGGKSWASRASSARDERRWCGESPAWKSSPGEASSSTAKTSRSAASPKRSRRASPTSPKIGRLSVCISTSRSRPISSPRPWTGSAGRA